MSCWRATLYFLRSATVTTSHVWDSNMDKSVLVSPYIVDLVYVQVRITLNSILGISKSRDPNISFNTKGQFSDIVQKAVNTCRWGQFLASIKMTLWCLVSCVVWSFIRDITRDEEQQLSTELIMHKCILSSLMSMQTPELCIQLIPRNSRGKSPSGGVVTSSKTTASFNGLKREQVTLLQDA